MDKRTTYSATRILGHPSTATIFGAFGHPSTATIFVDPKNGRKWPQKSIFKVIFSTRLQQRFLENGGFSKIVAVDGWDFTRGIPRVFGHFWPIFGTKFGHFGQKWPIFGGFLAKSGQCRLVFKNDPKNGPDFGLDFGVKMAKIGFSGIFPR